jgi:hypothetical protein
MAPDTARWIIKWILLVLSSFLILTTYHHITWSLASHCLGCSSPAEYQSHDPFCAIDATCVSVFYSDSNPGLRDWMGLRGWSLSAGQLRPSSPTHVLAIPNAILFILLASMLIAIVRWYLRVRWRRAAMTAIAIWCIGTIIWWFVDIATYDSTSYWRFLPEIFLTLFVASACWAGVVFGLKIRRD